MIDDDRRPQRLGEGFRINRYAERDGERELLPTPEVPDLDALPAPLPDAEITVLVEAVVAYEPWREVDESLLDIWTAQSAVGRWTFPEALRAIHAWAATRERGTFLDPADVTRAIRAEREDRLSRAAAPPRFTPEPDEGRARDRVTGFNEILAESGVRWRIGSVDDPTTFDPRGRHVPCSGDPSVQSGDTGCGAPAGEACTLRTGDRRKRTTPSGFVHPSRRMHELAFVNAARRERGMAELPASTANPRLPGYARRSRHPEPGAPPVVATPDGG